MVLRLPHAKAVRPWFLGALSVAFVLAAFAPVFSNGFVDFFDDGEHITGRGQVRQGLTWPGVRWAFSPGNEDYWHPLTSLSLMADVSLFGLRAGPMHAVNVGLHAVAALLLFVVLERMTGRTFRSAAVALLFAVHPLQVESVAWAVERKTVLSAAFGMAALASYVGWVRKPHGARYARTLVLYAASLLAKPALITLPALLLLLDVWPLGRTALAAPAGPDGAARATFRRLLVEKVPFAAFAIAMTAVAVLSRADVQLEAVPLGLRVSNAFTSVCRYVAKIAWPAGLSPYYPQAPEIRTASAVAAAAGIAGLLAVGWALRQRISPALAVGWAWFLVALAPVSGLVRTGLWPGMADRFVYLPIVGVLIACVWTVAAIVEGSRLGRCLAVASLAAAVPALAVATHVQARLWGDPVELFRQAVRVTPPNRVALGNLGHALRSAGRIEEAHAVFDALTELLPGLPDGPLNAGVLWHEEGKLAAADRAYALALQRDASCGRAYFNRGLLRKRWGDREAALRSFEAAVEVGYREPGAFEQLGMAYEAVGRDADAGRAYAHALLLNPSYWRAAARLGRLHAAAGRALEAESAFAQARRHAAVAGEDPRAVDEIAGALSGAGR